MHCGLFSSIYLLNASISPSYFLVVTKIISIPCQMSPGIQCHPELWTTAIGDSHACSCLRYSLLSVVEFARFLNPLLGSPDIVISIHKKRVPPFPQYSLWISLIVTTIMPLRALYGRGGGEHSITFFFTKFFNVSQVFVVQLNFWPMALKSQDDGSKELINNWKMLCCKSQYKYSPRSQSCLD